MCGAVTVMSCECFVHGVGPDTPFLINSCRHWKFCSNLVKTQMLLRQTKNRAMGPSTTFLQGGTRKKGNFC